MRRPAYRKPATQMSLFPFLAVLICTMGTLIVLLVLLVQQARLQADEVAQPSFTDLVKEVATPEKMRVEDAEFEFRLLEEKRGSMQLEVQRRKDELRHLEAHIADLQEQAKRLQQRAAALQDVQSNETADQQALEAERERLKRQLQTAREDLENARRAAAARPRTYAILPYDGPHGTRRRPVYVECRSDALIIQPEGIRLGAGDFGTVVGPGNPLDAALRAIREYYQQAGVPGEVYPLLIVRPDGSEAYAMARAAMRTWDDEFGYELVPEEMTLQYQAADQQLADYLEKAIEVAQRRQQILAAAMPSAYGGENAGGSAYVASRRGGFVPVDRGSQVVNRRGSFGQGSDERLSAGGPGETPEQLGSDPGITSTGSSGEARQVFGNPNAQGGGGSSLAQQRGENWGLPNASTSATGVTRPIRVACAHDRLVLLPDKGDNQTRPQTIMLYGALHQHVDQFVARVWNIMEGWGLAVVGGYWKPVLRVEVTPGGERRFLELKTALRDSGFVIERARR